MTGLAGTIFRFNKETGMSNAAPHLESRLDYDACLSRVVGCPSVDSFAEYVESRCVDRCGNSPSFCTEAGTARQAACEAAFDKQTCTDAAKAMQWSDCLRDSESCLSDKAHAGAQRAAERVHDLSCDASEWLLDRKSSGV